MSELRDFVIGFCREMGGLVEPPAYGVYSVLWPDELAERLQVEAYQKLAFDNGTARPDDDDVTLIYYGHPLVERIIEETRRRPVWTRLAIPEIRLDKRGLAGLAGSAISLANARFQTIPRAIERMAVGHYIRFNFKASLMSDEKQERLVSVLMYAQGGYAINQTELEQATALIEADSGLTHMQVIPLAWTPSAEAEEKAPGPLSRAALTGLLERAKSGATRELAAPMDHLRQRAQRHLELDRARLEQYYTDLQTDLERRLNKASPERQPALADKLAAVQVERQNKLLDIEAKYELRLTLELINLSVIVQPKVTLLMQIENRHASVQRTVVWDPLLHRIEPMVCDVCGEPGYQLHLCSNGHLAHKDCLAPQCVDCKRAYCQKCNDDVKSCVVCDRPVCARSLSLCSTCGRGTCQEHRDLCHAAEGQPLRQAAPPPPQPETPPEPVEVEAAPPVRAKAAKKPKTKTVVPARTRRTPTPARVTGQKIEVYIETAWPSITAYVIASGRELAMRTWELTPQGLAVWCRCEKGYFCPANQVLKRPETAARIEAQLQAEINALRLEYQVAPNKVSYFRTINNEVHSERRLLLRGGWKHEAALAAARAGFDERR
jgi:hypothetical protein